ncbi:MAG: phosphodiesterase, partial [Pseudomonadota bacterium]
MKLIQLTDCHLAEPDALRKGLDSRASFRAALADIATRHSDAALVAMTGDLSQDGEPADYDEIQALLEAFPLPVALTVGNHDDRAAFAEVFPQHMTDGFAQGVHDLPRGRALVLDTHMEGRHSGELCEARLAWLEAELAAHDQPHFIFMHHNPIPTYLTTLDPIMLREPQRLTALIQRYPGRVAHIFHGHTHLPMSGALAGVPVSCPRGTAHAGFPNYGENRLLPHADLPPSYNVIFVEEHVTTVMMVEYGL